MDNSNITGNKLLKIINKSVMTDVFPDNWKESMNRSIDKIRYMQNIPNG